MEKLKWKLTSSQKMFVCRLIAEGKTNKETIEALKKEHGVDVDRSNIRWYRNSKKYADLLNKMKEKFLSAVLEVPIAQKRVRLKRLEQKYLESQKMKDKDRIVYGLKCLKEAKEETKDEPAENSIQVNQYNELSNEELLQKKKELEQKIIELSKREDIQKQLEDQSQREMQG